MVNPYIGFQTICDNVKTVLGVVLCLQAEDNSDYLYNLFYNNLHIDTGIRLGKWYVDATCI